MANTYVNPTEVIREALRILHQESNFISNVTKGYDSAYAQTGAKIGDTVTIRKPPQYAVTDGATLGSQDFVQTSTSLQLSGRKHVPASWTTQEMTLDLDSFSEQFIRPAVKVLAANVEGDVLTNVFKDVYNYVEDSGNAGDFKDVLNARKELVNNLMPMDGRAVVVMNPQLNVDLVDALKGLFQAASQIEEQYMTGKMGMTGGFTFYENTLLPLFTSGTAVAGDTTYNINGTMTEGTSTLTIDTGSTTFLKGDLITLAGVNRVHPETKEDSGELQKFVVTADSGTSATSLSIAPAIYAGSDGLQNVTALPADNAAISKVLAANDVVDTSLAFHPEAFAFATADLVMPNGTDFAAREVSDGISMRVVRDYTISSDTLPTRLDILYGYKTIRPELASRLHFN